jgi:hypothetical protein
MLLISLIENISWVDVITWIIGLPTAIWNFYLNQKASEEYSCA